MRGSSMEGRGSGFRSNTSDTEPAGHWPEASSDLRQYASSKLDDL